MAECTHFVKARKAGEKVFRFISEKGTTNRRIFALRFTAEGARETVKVLTADNPGWEFRAQPMPKPRVSAAT